MHACDRVLSTAVVCCQFLGTDKVRKRFLSPLPANYVSSQLADSLEQRLTITETQQTEQVARVHDDHEESCDEVVDLGVPGQARRVRSPFLDFLYDWRNEQLSKRKNWRPSDDVPRELVRKIKACAKAGPSFILEQHEWALVLDEHRCGERCIACINYAKMLRNTAWVNTQTAQSLATRVPSSLRVHVVLVQHRVYQVLVAGVVPTDSRGRCATAVALGRIGALPFPRDPEEKDVVRWSSWCHKQGASNDKKAVTKLKPLVSNFGWRLVFASENTMSFAAAKDIVLEMHAYFRDVSEQMNGDQPHLTPEGAQLLGTRCPRLFNCPFAVYAVSRAYNIGNSVHVDEDSSPDVIRVLY